MGLNNVKIQKNFGKLKNWIGNKEVESKASQYIDLFTPYTGEIIGEVPMGTAADVAEAVKSAKAAFKLWSNTNIKERVQVMFKLKTLMERDFEELKQLVSLENGKTLAEAHGDVAKAIEVLEFGCSIPNKVYAPMLEVSNGIYCQVIKEPLGVVASIVPFNFPVMCPMWTIPIALTVGNTMVLKPSEQVPLGSMKLAKLLKEAGLPDGVLNVVHGGVDIVNGICDNADIRAVSFVGSTKVAKLVYGRAAMNGKRVLALGGAKNHLVLMPDANLETAPMQIVDSAMGCAGQRCMAASLMLAVGDCQKHIDGMVAYAKSIKLGEKQGTVINKQSVERINNYITQAEKMGAKILVDGRNAKPSNSDMSGLENGYWVGPTLLDNVSPDMPAGCEEIFGPVLSIVRVKTLEEALKIENNNPYGNAASIFTTNGANAQYLFRNANAGMNGVNVGVPVPREPFGFGGWNDSKFGNGDLTGDQGIDFWTQDRKITTKFIEPQTRNWMS
ncbi:MAG: CoA-acylating methylmalonate-semialdehyde dehydrogenase [Bacteriovoracaceae bacterium]|nr:CoA-acylating methylmalonate-semialdehyde dehydrogenase [Bacteriovoracaceae bacterium]